MKPCCPNILVELIPKDEIEKTRHSYAKWEGVIGAPTHIKSIVLTKWQRKNMATDTSDATEFKSQDLQNLKEIIARHYFKIVTCVGHDTEVNGMHKSGRGWRWSQCHA